MLSVVLLPVLVPPPAYFTQFFSNTECVMLKVVFCALLFSSKNTPPPQLAMLCRKRHLSIRIVLLSADPRTKIEIPPPRPNGM